MHRHVHDFLLDILPTYIARFQNHRVLQILPDASNHDLCHASVRKRQQLETNAVTS
jgi:hypothetical protein